MAKSNTYFVNKGAPTGTFLLPLQLSSHDRDLIGCKT